MQHAVSHIYIFSRTVFVSSHLTIIGRGWAKISWFACGEQTIICRSRRLRQIINLRDCQITILCLSFDHQVYFHIQWISDSSEEQNAIFTREWGCSYPWAELFANLGGTHGQTFICGQLFAAHVVGSAPMKPKKNPSSDNIIFLSHIPNFSHSLQSLAVRVTLTDPHSFEFEFYLRSLLCAFPRFNGNNIRDANK